METLEALIASRKTLNTRRMELFKSYNTPRLMGVQGCNVDGFLARLSKDVTACKLETFNWKDYQILTCINTLTNDKDEVRLAEKLIKVYNRHTAANTQMTLANVGTEVKQFWRDIKETQDLIFNGTKPGGGGNSQGQGQGKKDKRARKRGKKKSASPR